jgi:hypothetical protein
MNKKEAYVELHKLLNEQEHPTSASDIIDMLCNCFSTDILKEFINFIKDERS